MVDVVKDPPCDRWLDRARASTTSGDEGNRMFPRTRMPSAATALLGLVALFATPASAAEVVLRFGSINTENTAGYDQMLLQFASYVDDEADSQFSDELMPLI